MSMEYDAPRLRGMAKIIRDEGLSSIADILECAVAEAERLRAELAAEKSRSFFDRPEWTGRIVTTGTETP